MAADLEHRCAHRGARRRLAQGLALLVALASLTASCTMPTHVSGPQTAPKKPARATTTTTTEPPLADVAVQWSACAGGLQCTAVIAPLDYAHPQDARVAIALERRPASNPAQRIGSLVLNPGGPGVSGIDGFANQLRSLTAGLLDRFDVVTFDPRGVGRSDPITCGETPGGAPTQRPDQYPQTPTARAGFIDALRSYAAACEKASGAILPHVGTVDVARDLDRIRVALGDATLTFMGQSYGTLLGATYADMFPDHVRALVLDGVIDPATSFDDMVLLQAQGFENSLHQFFAWCAQSSSCAWRTTADPTGALLALIDQSRHQPLATRSARTAGPGEFYDALLSGLYSPSYWGTLGSALARAAGGNGAGVLAMSDHYNTAGTPNVDDANLAINCMDHPVSRDLASYPKRAAAAARSAPVFGPVLAWGEASCAVWPVAPTRRPGPVRALGTPPILVIGATSDPATRYSWAVNVAGELAHGVLLTRTGGDHVSYFYSSCVRSYVQSYLLSGVTPPSGTTCAS